MSDSLEVVCPKCHSDIPLDDIDTARDAAFCRKCSYKFRFSEAIGQGESQVDLTRPPKGVWYARRPNGFELGLSTRSFIAVFLVPFTIFWASRLYGSLIARQHFDLANLLFSLPFLFGTVVLSALTLMTLWGKFCVRAEGKNGEVFIGIGSLGYRKKFCWTDVKDIRIDSTRSSRGTEYKHILIDASQKVIIPNVSTSRMGYFLAALRQLRRDFFPSAESSAVPPRIAEVA